MSLRSFDQNKLNFQIQRPKRRQKRLKFRRAGFQCLCNNRTAVHHTRMIQGYFSIDVVSGPDASVDELLSRHFADMRAGSPEESCHVMTSQDLRNSGALLYALRNRAGEVCAVGALKPFEDGVELKSMHTAHEKRGLGYGGAVLHSLLETARIQGAEAAWLETGSQPSFAAARAMYRSAGFEECLPFGSYTLDPLSTFMVLKLR